MRKLLYSAALLGALALGCGKSSHMDVQTPVEYAQTHRVHIESPGYIGFYKELQKPEEKRNVSDLSKYAWQAVNELTNARKDNPDSNFVDLFLVHVYSEGRNYERALQIVDSVIESAEKSGARDMLDFSTRLRQQVVDDEKAYADYKLLQNLR